MGLRTAELSTIPAYPPRILDTIVLRHLGSGSAKKPKISAVVGRQTQRDAAKSLVLKGSGFHVDEGASETAQELVPGAPSSEMKVELCPG